ncbi:MAG: cyclase family protein [Xanthobacteraceae bacterium]|jgi:kynurenine formamidase
MARRIVDLSVALETGIKSDPPVMLPQINYFDHQAGFATMGPMFPGLKIEQMIGGEAGAVETVAISTHNGTHLDAPYHFSSTMDHALPGGPRASKTIDEIDLNWCFQPGVKLDFRRFESGYLVRASDVEAELKRIGHTLKPLEIVLVNTGAATRYGQDDYIDTGCGMGREATLYLLERGVRVTGIDAWTWDVPFSFTRKRFAETGDGSIIWEGHKAGREIGYCHMEKLTNLDLLPPDGFTVACFPTKIRKASAGWTRAVAIFED